MTAHASAAIKGWTIAHDAKTRPPRKSAGSTVRDINASRFDDTGLGLTASTDSSIACSTTGMDDCNGSVGPGTPRRFGGFVRSGGLFVTRTSVEVAL